VNNRKIDKYFFTNVYLGDKLKKMILGDPAVFAISYIPEPVISSSKHVYAYCHLILGGEFIGTEDEYCLMGTWLHKFEHLLDRVVKENLSNPLFSTLTDQEIFQLILKSNQLKREHDPAYAYLPVWPSGKWSLHTVLLDETIDSYIIQIVEQEGRLKFIWRKEEKLSAVSVEREVFIKTAKQFLTYVDQDK
jgi:hypothetical protein